MAGWGTIPALRTADMARAIDFYTRVLGFTLRRGGPEENHCSLFRGEANLMIETPSGFYSPGYNAAIGERLGTPGATALYIEAEDLEALAAAAEAAGAKVIDPLADREWGQAEFTLEDPDGNWLTFWKAPAQQ